MKKILAILALTFFVGLPALASPLMYFGIGPSSGASAVQDKSAQFTVANSEYLSRADGAALSTGDIDFNVGAWVYLDSKTTFREIITKYDVIGQREYVLEYTSSSDRFTFYVYDGTSVVGTAVANTLGIPATATWYFVQAYHDATGNTVGISVDDGTVDSAATSGAPIDSTAGFLVGAVVSGVPTLHFDGRIQSAFFAKSMLSTTNITSLYNSGVAKEYCQLSGAQQALFTGWWNLTEVSGDRSDSTANALTLTDNATVTQADGVSAGSCN